MSMVFMKGVVDALATKVKSGSTLPPLTSEKKDEARGLNELNQAFDKKGMQCTFGPHGPYGKAYRWAAKFFGIPKKNSVEAEKVISWIHDKSLPIPKSGDSFIQYFLKARLLTRMKEAAKDVIKKDDATAGEIMEGLLSVKPELLWYHRMAVNPAYGADDTKKALDDLISLLSEFKEKADQDPPKLGRAEIPGHYDQLRVLAIMHYLAAKGLKKCDTDGTATYSGLGEKYVQIGDLFMALARIKHDHAAAQITHNAEETFKTRIKELMKDKETRTGGLMRTLLAHFKRELLDDRSITAWYSRTPFRGAVICDPADPKKEGAVIAFVKDRPGFATYIMDGNHDPLTAFAKYARAGAMLCAYDLKEEKKPAPKPEPKPPKPRPRWRPRPRPRPRPIPRPQPRLIKKPKVWD